MENDSQRLLADLAAEYERSTRFLQQLEGCLTKENVETYAAPERQSSGAAPDDEQPEHLSTPDATDTRSSRRSRNIGLPSPPSPAPSVPASPVDTPLESGPAKLRAKLRSLFARRVAIQEKAQQAPAPGGAPVQAQPKPPAHQPSPPPNPNPAQQEREPPAAGWPAYARCNSARRASTVLFNSDAVSRVTGAAAGGSRASLDMADFGSTPAGGRAERPVTGRRASIVYFGGALLDGPSRGGADLRVIAPGGSAFGAVGTESFEAPQPQPQQHQQHQQQQHQPGASRRPTAASARRASHVLYGSNVAANTAAALGLSRAGTPVPPALDIDRDTGGSNGSRPSEDAATPTGGGGGPNAGGRRASVVHFGGGILDSGDLQDLLPHRSSSVHQQRASPGAALTPTGARMRTHNSGRRTSIDAQLQYRQAPPTHHAEQLAGGTGRSSLDQARPLSLRAAMAPTTLSGGAAGAGDPGASSYSGTNNVNTSSIIPHASSGSQVYLQPQQPQQQQQPRHDTRVTDQPHLRLQNSPQPMLHVPAVAVAWASTASPLSSPNSGLASAGELGAFLQQGMRPSVRTAGGGSEARRTCLASSNSMRRRRAGGLTSDILGSSTSALLLDSQASCGQVSETSYGLLSPAAIVTAPAAAPIAVFFDPSMTISGQADVSPVGSVGSGAGCGLSSLEYSETPMRSRGHHPVTAAPATPQQQQVQGVQGPQQVQQSAPVVMRVRSMGASHTGMGGGDGARARRSGALVSGPRADDHTAHTAGGGYGEYLHH